MLGIGRSDLENDFRIYWYDCASTNLENVVRVEVYKLLVSLTQRMNIR